MKLTTAQRAELMGKRVVFSQCYCVRKRKHHHHSYYIRTVDIIETKIKTGWIVGFSIMRAGIIEYIGNEEGITFVPGEGYPCVLIRETPNGTTVRIPLDALTLDSDWEVLS